MSKIELASHKTIAPDEKIQLTEEQRLMLEMSESDISNHRLITQLELDTYLEWESIIITQLNNC